MEESKRDLKRLKKKLQKKKGNIYELLLDKEKAHELESLDIEVEKIDPKIANKIKKKI
jgi:hypothetical protein